MISVIVERAQEGSTYAVSIRLYERRMSVLSSNSITIIPSSASWTLLDDNGEVVNGKDSIPISPSSRMTVVLSGADLILNGDYPERRRLIIEGTYDGAYGSNLPFRKELIFHIEDIKGTP